MAFMAKKKRFKFQVNFEVEELLSVPFVSGILFAKLRLLDGGNYVEYSGREEVKDHQVKWQAKSSFQCKMSASANTGMLEPCVCRVSVRKELKGGKSFQKLGFADVDLAEFAGAGLTTRKCLLDGYDSKRRQDNSTLKVNIEMSLLSGDPCFKAAPPRSQSSSILGAHVDDLKPESKGGSVDDNSGDSVASGSSGFGSLPRKTRNSVSSDPKGSQSDLKKEQLLTMSEKDGIPAGHSRNSSSTSQQSKVSGYVSAGASSVHTSNHSRHSSYDDNTPMHRRSQSSDSNEQVKFGSLGHRKKLEASSSIDRRLGSTRVDADELIDDLIKNTDFQVDENAETSGLQLFVGKDGSTVLGSQQTRNKTGAGTYERVVFDQR